MTQAHDNLDATLRAVAAGDFDALTPEQIALLERALNESPQFAARLADAVPTPDARLAAGLAQLERAALPSEQEWEQVWRRVEAGGEHAAIRPGKAGVVRFMRVFRPLLAAAAACLLAVGVWDWQKPRPATDWPMQLATNVEIDGLEVGDDATFYIATDDGVNVIWVLQG